MAERDLGLLNSDELRSNISDMNVLAIRFSFMMLYVLALPALTALAWVANFMEGHNDLHKFLSSERRQWPCDAASIGSWAYIYRFVAVAAVVTNTCCLFFTVRWTPYDHRGLDRRERVAGAFLAQYMIFAVMCLIEAMIPSEPHFVHVQLQRQAFVDAKLIDRLADEADEEDEADDDDEKPLVNLAKLKHVIRSKVLKKRDTFTEHVVEEARANREREDRRRAREEAASTPYSRMFEELSAGNGHVTVDDLKVVLHHLSGEDKTLDDIHDLCDRHDPAYDRDRNTKISLDTFTRIAEKHAAARPADLASQ